jgi:hypothetical protein
MKEHMPDTELTRSLYEERDEYMIDMQRKLGVAEVFEMARDVQAQWNGMRLREEELRPWFNAAVGTTILRLDRQAYVDGAMGEKATIEGASVALPKFDVDLRTGVVLVSSHSDEERNKRLLEQTLHPGECRGEFAGFMPRFEQIVDSEVYRPVLQYQIATESQAMPHIAARLMATADIEEAQLQFESDMKTDQRWGLLSVLYDTAPSRCVASINRLVTTLSGQRELNGSLFRHIGYHASKVVDGVDEGVRSEVEDMMIDLLSSYFDVGSYQLEANRVVCADTENMGTLQHLLATRESRPIRVNAAAAPFSTMLFMDHSTVQGEYVVYHQGRM